jgi:hypothetical protein
VEQGGVLIADRSPGTSDARGRKLSKSYLSDFFDPLLAGVGTERNFGRGKAVYLNVDPVSYFRGHLASKEKDLQSQMRRILETSLPEAEFRLRPVRTASPRCRNSGVSQRRSENICHSE